MASPHGSPPLPRPKSPPELYGKRREFAKVVMLEREIGFLQEELKSIETLRPASSCIKEVADYMVANPEPLITTCKKTRKSCGFWKWLCGNSCFNMSWVCCCCCCYCCTSLQTPKCCCSCSFPECCSCSLPKCSCGFRPGCPKCLKECFSCPKCDCPKCDCPKCPSCPDCSCCCKCSFSCCCPKPKCSCPKLPKCTSCACFSLKCCYNCCQCC
ncbi:guanine nucleotide-binding protein subunit gamma 3-like [Cynara cardunculus var. scolymus]|uniref:guanine nucleotide-binding protein subunit gamma 3-like n=1 Tax=Cynara cardunculus var. scolymus TaxID=59895 RepID=UPI000D62B59D|nr:guanine nucleotide-binding protein subunit gamma 3-like [Cynara cardunculus var. scolymus]